MKPALLLPLAFLFALPVRAATHAVIPGTAIQAKVDIAAPGDIVAIFGGTYWQDITVNKPIQFVEVSGQEVNITGSITWTGVVNAPPFEGFKTGSPGKGITVTNTTGLVFKNLDSTAGGSIVCGGATTLDVIDSQLGDLATGGTTTAKVIDSQLRDLATGGTTTVKVIDSQLGSLSAGGKDVEISRSSISGNMAQSAGVLHATSVTVAGGFDSTDAASRSVFFRTTVGDWV